jgi:GntR family transcriptional regulator, transcriptional repressor for pyruvate dehydrogenase complex
MRNKNGTHMVATIEPIDRSGITELVIRRIKELLASGELKAGSRLPPERQLAEMFNISRPSLRTALRALSVMGIIRAKPGTGTFIAEALPEVLNEPMHFMTLIHKTSLEELFEVRRSIEAALAECAAQRASEADIAIMASEVQGMRQAIGDPEQFLKHDIAFHQAIARASGNRVMSVVMDTVGLLLYETRRQTVGRSTDFREAVGWHQRIYEAIRRHEPRRARELMTRHLNAALSAYESEGRQPKRFISSSHDQRRKAS